MRVGYVRGNGCSGAIFILFVVVVVVVVRFVCYFVDSFPYCVSTFIQFYKFITVRLLS